MSRVPSAGFAPALMMAPARAETGVIDMTRQTPDPDQLARLRELLPPGTTVYCILRHVSRSGMQRRISLMIWKDGQPFHLDGLVTAAYPDRFRHARYPLEGISVLGAGMDMGFELVYRLGYALYSTGFDCPGETCPRLGTCTETRHNDGGYALRHQWL